MFQRAPVLGMPKKSTCIWIYRNHIKNKGFATPPCLILEGSEQIWRFTGGSFIFRERWRRGDHWEFADDDLNGTIMGNHLGMDQYLLIPFLVGWTSIYQLFWCSPGVQGFDTLPSINGGKSSIISGMKKFWEVTEVTLPLLPRPSSRTSWEKPWWFDSENHGESQDLPSGKLTVGPWKSPICFGNSSSNPDDCQGRTVSLLEGIALFQVRD